MKKLYLNFLMLCLILMEACSEKQKEKIIEPVVRPVDLVYTQLDAANSRWFYFSSACRPFGMVNLSPDNQKGGAWGSGYRYNTDTIKGFSHVHAWQMSGIEVMPVSINKNNKEAIIQNPQSHFSHSKETAQVGYHKVALERYNIQAELTSTKRVGFHKYQFNGQKASVVFNLSGQLGPSEISMGSIDKIDNRTFEGKVLNAPTHRRPKNLMIYFRVEFDQDVVLTEEIDRADLNKVVVSFGNQEKPLLMKVAISYTSQENAKLNLDSELPHWDFDRVIKESKNEWNNLLSRIDVAGKSDDDVRRFYTDLWHALQGRRIVSDVNGQYPDNTGDSFRIGQIELDQSGSPKFNHYNSDSFWGAQWTINTLWQLVYPEIAEEFCNSLLQYYRDGGLIPRGPSGGNYTYVMTGASSTPFLVSAWLKGIRGFNIESAYEGMKKNHMPGGIMAKAGYEHYTARGGGLQYYLENGYVPYPFPEEGDFGSHKDGAGQTLEYAYQDWNLSQLAKHLGKQQDYEYFLSRSENYKKLYDENSGWIRPKNASGEWKEPFDPYEYEHGFVESNGAQMTWFVPHDLEGLADLMGGQEVAVEKLNEQFEKASKQGFTSGKAHAKERDKRNRRVPINYGNQPSIQTAFIFNRLGRPDLTQQWAKQVLDSAYSGLSPEIGFSGDEDQGLMGSLSVLMKMGLFQMTGAEDDPIYDLSIPIFDTIKIKLNQDYYPGDQITISRKIESKDGTKTANASLNNTALPNMQITHSKLIKGGIINIKD